MVTIHSDFGDQESNKPDLVGRVGNIIQSTTALTEQGCPQSSLGSQAIAGLGLGFWEAQENGQHLAVHILQECWMDQKDSGGMSHEGKIRSNLGEMDSLSGQSEQGGVIGGRLLENWPCVFSLLTVSRSPVLSCTMCAEEPEPLEVAPASQCW